MSAEPLPTITPPSRLEKRSRSLTRLIDYNEVTRVVIEEPNFTHGVSFKNFRNVYKTSYVQANAAQVFMKGKSASPDKKASSAGVIESEKVSPREKSASISLQRVSNSPSPQSIYD